MDGKGETYRYRGNNLDLWLTYRLDRGLYLRILVKDKEGRLLEGKEFAFDETTVKGWLQQILRENMRRFFHKPKGG